MVSFSLNSFMLNRKVYGGCLIWPTLYNIGLSKIHSTMSVFYAIWNWFPRRWANMPAISCQARLPRNLCRTEFQHATQLFTASSRSTLVSPPYLGGGSAAGNLLSRSCSAWNIRSIRRWDALLFRCRENADDVYTAHTCSVCQETRVLQKY